MGEFNIKNLAREIIAGRNYFKDGGANATITGDMLTTVGNNTSQDKKMLTHLGFDISK